MSFEVHKDGTISVHEDNMNPNEIKKLIKRLQGNLLFLKFLKKEDPIKVMTESVRLYRDDRQIRFNLSWSADELVGDLDNAIPEPNVELSEEDYDRYRKTYSSMTNDI